MTSVCSALTRLCCRCTPRPVLRDVEIEWELLDKLRNGVVGFFVLPYWGWSRILEDNTQTLVAAWCALSGAVSLYTVKLSEPR